MILLFLLFSCYLAAQLSQLSIVGGNRQSRGAGGRGVGGRVDAELVFCCVQFLKTFRFLSELCLDFFFIFFVNSQSWGCTGGRCRVGGRADMHGASLLLRPTSSVLVQLQQQCLKNHPVGSA